MARAACRMVVYCLFPFVYLVINATKTQADFTSTFGLGFGKSFALWDNIVTVFTYQTFRRLISSLRSLRVLLATAMALSRSFAV